MNSNQDKTERPQAPAKIACRVCMSTAEIAEQFIEAEAIDLSGLGIGGTLVHATYHCPEGHVTHAVYDSAEGSLKFNEPEGTNLEPPSHVSKPDSEEN
ncbi:MAG: hypothetical protein PHX83_06350 [Acidobacteriia bacterium]|nr:hypothetical protein [Terriglobia bacterium]